MLSRADAEIARRDRALPGLAAVLDGEQLLGGLRKVCPRSSIAELETNYTRYKPGTSCVVGFTVTVEGARCRGYARTDNARRSRSPNGHRAPAVPTLTGGGRFALADGRTVVAVFPNDRRMASLAEIAVPERLDSLLKDLLPTAAHLRDDARVEPLAYRPEHSFAGKLVSRHGVAVLKFPGDRQYRPVPARAGRFAGGFVRRPALLGYSDRHRAEVLEWLDGRVLSEALHDPAFDTRAMWLVGAALADFHAHVRPGLVELTSPTRVDLQAHADAIGALCPRLAVLARRIADRLGALEFPPRLYRRLHGDFHPRQILIDGQRVAFLDLCDECAGHPAIDAGLFLAHLEREAIRRGHAGSWVEPLARAFLNGYESASEVSIRQSVPRAVAAALFRLAPRCFRHRELDWPVQMEALVERAQEVAHGQKHTAA